MRVLIIEPHATGHHVSYLRWLVQACRRKQFRVVIATTTTALLHPSFSGIVAEFEDTEFHLIKDFNKRHGVASGSLQLARREFAYWKAFKKTVEEVCILSPIDQIILPYIDYCFHALALFGSPFNGIPWCAISMRLA